ncbi:MAG TPA: glycosyltransferase family 4 protein [Actinomycetes bacterium]|jgi:glycogen(starch) synthase|nr:glycosyltransferase family 4 protein [Actinomycetes bacterium]
MQPTAATPGPARLHRPTSGPRILHLTTEYPPVIYGGLGTAVGGWVTASARAGMTMGVLLVEGPLVIDPAVYGAGAAAPVAQRHGVVDRQGVRFFQTPWPEAVPTGVRLARDWQADVVHLHTAMLWAVAEAIQQQTGKPLVYHVHSVDRAEYELGQEPNQWLAHSHAQEAAIHAADRLIALSQDERDLLARYYPTCQDRIRVVGNGIDDSAQARAAVRKQRHTPTPLVLYSGRLVERKGIRELLAAIPLVLRAAPGTRFVLAGGPPGLSGARLRQQWLPAELARHQHQIDFTGWLAPEQVAAWYRRADVLVVPSRYEPFGMVILEGMLHGLPILASAVGGPAEILRDERTGLLFPPMDVPALGRQLIRLVHNAGLRQQLGVAAAAELRSKWLWPQTVQAMRHVYGEVVPAAPTPVLRAS